VNRNAAVFIDGGYLNKINKKPYKLDFMSLIKKLAAPLDLWRSYYYTCTPYMPPNSTVSDRERYDKAVSFYQRLRQIPRMEVRLGKLKMRGLNSTGEPIFVQKRVDLMLGLDMASVFASNKVDVIVLLAGDGDMFPAVEAAKNANVIVKLAHGERNSYDRELWEKADERIELDDAFFQSIAR
jgi:uncharacterized LabA/DUF88 family protein